MVVSKIHFMYVAVFFLYLFIHLNQLSLAFRAENKHVKLLEIGLGCNMNYGPGASYELWRSYFNENVDIYFIEYNCNCAKRLVVSISASLFDPDSHSQFEAGRTNQELRRYIVAINQMANF